MLPIGRREGTSRKYYAPTAQPSGTGCYCQISGWNICARLHPADSYVPAYVGKSFEKYHSPEEQGHDPNCTCDGHYCCLHVISLRRKRSYSSMLSSAKEKPEKFAGFVVHCPIRHSPISGSGRAFAAARPESIEGKYPLEYGRFTECTLPMAGYPQRFPPV